MNAEDRQGMQSDLFADVDELQIVAALIFGFVILGGLSQALAITCQDSRHFFVLGGMILGFVIAQVWQKYKK